MGEMIDTEPDQGDDLSTNLLVNCDDGHGEIIRTVPVQSERLDRASNVGNKSTSGWGLSGDNSVQVVSLVQSNDEVRESRDDPNILINDDAIDPSQAERKTCSSHDEVLSDKGALLSEEIAKIQSSFELVPCESPRFPVLDNRQYQITERKQVEYEMLNELITGRGNLDEDCVDRPSLQHEKLTSSPHQSVATDLALVFPDHSDSNMESNKLKLVLNEAEVSQSEAKRNGESMHLNHPCVTLQSQTNNKPSPFNSPTPVDEQVTYTVESLFPVVYESVKSLEAAQKTCKEVPRSSGFYTTQKSTQRQRVRSDDKTLIKRLTLRLTALQAQLDNATSNLKKAIYSYKLQLSIAERDCKKLSERNARLKTQNALLTTSLQRSIADLSKFKTESEIYANKLPLLQAELLEETSQLDEIQAQSLQAQVAMVQLKARSHVLQTRNLSIDAQNKKLMQQLRDCQQQLKSKAGALQQHIEKAKSTEGELNELKITYAREKYEWKNRLKTTLQRFEWEKKRLETAMKAHEEKKVCDVKSRAAKASKKRQSAKDLANKLQEQLKQCKDEVSCARDTLQQRSNEVRNLESLLRRAHRTEATLRSELLDCKSKLRTEQKHRTSTARQFKRHCHQIPMELLLPVTDSSEDEDENNPANDWSRDALAAQSSPLRCRECLQLHNQLEHLQQELRRLRLLHATEMEAQATVLDALLCRGN